MMRTLSEAKKLELNEKQFIGKPLKTLLKEIKPKIKTAIVAPGDSERPNYFFFRFVTKKEYDMNKLQGKSSLTIIVYIKENFKWDRKSKSVEDYANWTKEDERKYGNLTIGAIRIYGEN